MSWYRPKVPPPNPFGEDADDDTQEEGTRPEPAEGVGAVTNTGGASSEPVGDTSRICASDLDETGNTESSLPDVTEAAGPSDKAQGHTLPRSLSVPAIAFAKCDFTEANESDPVPSSQSKV